VTGVAIRYLALEACDGPFGSSLTSSHYTDDGTRVIRLGNIGSGTWRGTAEAYISHEYADTLAHHRVAAGDVVIAGLGDGKHPLGRACEVPENALPAIVKADCFRLRLDATSVERRFFVYAMNAVGTVAADKRSHGSTRSRLPLSSVLDIKLPLPSLEVQRRIADMLDAETARIDTLIEKKRAAVGSAQVRLERMRWDLMTGRISSAERREVALAWADTLPETWPLVTLQYLITSKYGFPFKSEGFTSDVASTPVVRIRDVVPNRVQTWTDELPAGDVWLDDGDIVIGMDGDFNHVRWEGGRAALNQRVCSVRSSSEILTDDFLTEVIGYPLRHINETVHFTTVKHLSFADLMAEKIPLPPVAAQTTIVRELASERDATERLAAAANRSIELLKLRRQALITAAVTGQIEV